MNASELCLWASVAAPLVAAALAIRADWVRPARRIGIAGMAVGSALAAIPVVTARLQGLALLSAAEPVPAVLPLFVSLIGLVAVSLSPHHESGPGTLVRILAVSVISSALVVVRHPVVLAVLFGASAVPVWLQLRARAIDHDAARVFAAYLVPSSVLVGAGVLLASMGNGYAGALVLALGIAIREATVPFHSWLPHLVQRAPLGLSVAFVAPQLGVYMHLRVLAQRLPESLTYGVAAIGVVTVLLGAAMGAVQRRPRRALGYLMMSQSALVAFGLEVGSGLGHVGALGTWLVCGLSMTGLAMSLAALEARRGVLDLDHPVGSFRHVPQLASAFLVLGLASVGLPGTLGFVAEDLLVQGSVERYPVLGLSLILGTALNSITVVRMFFALFTGSRRHTGERDLRTRERVALGLLMAVLLVAGAYPRLLLGDPVRGGEPHHVAQLSRC